MSTRTHPSATRTAPLTGTPAASVPGSPALIRVLVEHALRMQWRAVVIWGLALGALSALIVGIYPSFGSNFDELLQQYPQGMLDFLGSSQAGTIEGFLALEVFSMMAPLLLAGYAIVMASRSLAGAEERGTLDVLLSNPISRRQLVVSSFLTIALALLGVLLILGGLTWITALIAGVDLPFSSLADGVGNLLPLCLFFGGLALLVSALAHRGMLATAIPVGVLVAMYFLDALSNMSGTIEPLRILSAFHYYGSAIENGIDWPNAFGLTALGVVFMVLATVAFDRRDLYT
jgi:ABC-2 type transport system permease protein